MKQYIVDAFTKEAFKGNPAAVCVMDSWPSEEFMMKFLSEIIHSGRPGMGISTLPDSRLLGGRIGERRDICISGIGQKRIS